MCLLSNILNYELKFKKISGFLKISECVKIAKTNFIILRLMKLNNESNYTSLNQPQPLILTYRFLFQGE